MKPPPGAGLRISLLHTAMITIGVFVFAAAIVLSSISEGLPVSNYDPEGSRYGYTISLLLVWLPIIVLFFWFKLHPDSKKQSWGAFGWTVGVLTPVWCLLDVFAAPSLFQFPNCTAHSSIYIPGWVPGDGFQRIIPIEEVFFYLGSCILTLLVYIWGSMTFFKSEMEYIVIETDNARGLNPLITFDKKVLFIGVGLLILAFIYKLFLDDGKPPPFPSPLINCPPGPNMEGQGIPLYFTLLMLLVFVPAVLIWNKSSPYINPGAMFFTIVAAVLFSLIWEATLALPYGWWNYNPKWMIGIFVPPWHYIPLEAIFLWLFAGWGTVLIFEFFRLLIASHRTFYEAAFRKFPMD